MSEPISILSESSSVRGRVSGDGDLEVRGRVEGELDITGALTIAEGAIVRASLRASTVVVRGAVRGDVRATELVVIEESARLVGNVHAPRVAISAGAQVRGAIEMGGEFTLAKIESAAAKHTRPAAAPAARPAPAPAARPAASPAARPAPAPVARAPFPAARVAIPARRPEPVAAPVVVEAASNDEVADDASTFSEPSTPGATNGEGGRREPPLPLVPAIKKGAKAAPAKRKGTLS
jgi:cytoskeletal protein CcmA (bactofilin family)